MPDSYVTVQGDKWDLIAHQQLGDTRHMNKLMAANPQYLDYYIFPAGIELQLPEIDPEQAGLSSLPPWRQVV
ncbi:MAG: phage tail protein [Clostridiales bacterium]|jgi:phage tail protein X|nr:phage tail protein [Clostridiales bacterium]